MEHWHVWMIAAVMLFIFEIFTPTFFCVCLGLGCAVAGIGALIFHDVYVLQWSLFAAGGTISFVYLRPAMQKYFYRKKDNIKTNTDLLCGKRGRVTEIIDQSAGTGRVSVGGDDWRAYTNNGDILPVGTSVIVKGLDGINVVVEKA
jgi:membrane protein implicated in regulation of membrane protease activity